MKRLFAAAQPVAPAVGCRRCSTRLLPKYPRPVAFRKRFACGSGICIRRANCTSAPTQVRPSSESVQPANRRLSRRLRCRRLGLRVQIDNDKSATVEVHISGAYQMNASGEPPLRADFPIEVRANDGHLLITALMPMEEYIAGVLAGETGNFKSDEALKAMAVAARTFAMHFGSRHALDGFDFCDTTHCQDLRIAGIDAHLRSIAQATAGEILWYDGEPAATYYAANCGGTSEDGTLHPGQRRSARAVSASALRPVLRAQRRHAVAQRSVKARTATRAGG